MDNSNKGVVLADDEVFFRGSPETKEAIRTRTLSEAVYGELQEEILANRDQMAVNIRNFDPSGIDQFAIEVFSKGRYLGSEYTDRQDELFAGYVVQLLKGETISISEIQAMGLDPRAVRIKTNGLILAFIVNRNEKIRKAKWAHYNLVGKRPTDR